MPIESILPGAIITAEQFNALVDRYNNFWQGLSYAFDVSHQSDAERRYGWGQPQAVYPQVSPSVSITSVHANHLIAQINAGLWHINEDNLAELLPFRSPATSILASVYTQIDSILTTQFEPYKFDADQVGEWSVPANVVRLGTSPWNDSLQSEVVYTFTDYDEARHYFNSGGQFSVSLTSVNGSPGSAVWADLFASIGEIRIGADYSTTTGVNKGTYIDRGFYDMLVSGYTTVFDAGGWAVGEFGNTIYVASEYNSRRVQIALWADEIGGTFNIYLKATLIEDIGDQTPEFAIDSDITLAANFLEVFETPSISDPNIYYFTVPVEGTVYQFSSPTNPTVALFTEWTEVIVPLGDQL